MSSRLWRCVAVAQPGHLGDVLATLPIAGLLKERMPGIRIVFIGAAYSRLLLEACEHVDTVLDIAQLKQDPAPLRALQPQALLNPWLKPSIGALGKLAGIPVRVGNLRRPKSLLWANRWIYQASRQAALHTVQINLSYLRALGVDASDLPRARLHEYFGLTRVPALDPQLRAELVPDRFNLVLHPKSKKKGREWPARHFRRLVDLLPSARYRILLTGRECERAELLAECPGLLQHPAVVDLMGRIPAEQLLPFLGAVDGLVAAGTGPLHLAAALGRPVLGLFPGRNSIDATRWFPLGPRSDAIQLRPSCRPGGSNCPRRYEGGPCPCIDDISPEMVAARICAWERSGP